MNTYHLRRGRLQAVPDEEERQAPSGIVSACQFQARWFIAMGIVLITLAVVAPLWMAQQSERIRLLTEAMRKPVTDLPQLINYFAAGCSLLCAMNAMTLFFCAAGMRFFADSRLVVDLHRAMRRLRTVWRHFAVSMLLITAAVMWAWLSGKLDAVP
jgi:hypothetical protein